MMLILENITGRRKERTEALIIFLGASGMCAALLFSVPVTLSNQYVRTSDDIGKPQCHVRRRQACKVQ